MTERELQDKFVSWLNAKKKENEYIFEEVDTMYAMTDVVLYTGNKNNGYEIKLKDIKKVVEQALTNQLRYERNFLVMPIKEFDKLENLPDPYKKRAKELGLIGYDGETFKIIRYSKLTETYINYKMGMMDRIIRGFYKGGINQRVSYR